MWSLFCPGRYSIPDGNIYRKIVLFSFSPGIFLIPQWNIYISCVVSSLGGYFFFQCWKLLDPKGEHLQICDFPCRICLRPERFPFPRMIIEDFLFPSETYPNHLPDGYFPSAPEIVCSFNGISAHHMLFSWSDGYFSSIMEAVRSLSMTYASHITCRNYSTKGKKKFQD